MSRKVLLEEVESTETFVVETPHEETNKIPVAQQLVLLAAILLLIFGTTITPKVVALLQKSDATAALIPLITETTENVDVSEDTKTEAFNDIQIRGKAAYVWDIQNQKALYKKDESEKLPLASVAKLMTALVAQEVLEETDEVSIDDLSLRQNGDSGLAAGETFNRLTLSDLVLMSSSNDGAFALASAAGSMISPGSNGANSFVTAMNIRAEELGLTQTHFVNPTGLDISESEAGAFGSARDMAFLMEYIVQNASDILTYTKEDGARVWSESGQYHDAENTNRYIDEIPGLIGSKTGYTDLAGGNLVVAFDAGLNRPIVAVVLGSTQQERFTDILKLVEETQKYVTQSSQQ